MTNTRKPEPEETKEYRVARAFWNGPRLMAEGDTLHLTDAQAKYRGSEIQLTKPELKVGKRPKPLAQDEAAS